MSEAFAVGDMVTYTGWPLGKALQCKIIKIMPPDLSNPVRNYRVRDTSEAFERAVPEFTLTRIEPGASDLVFRS
jgi:hypothetical protein